MGKIVAIGGGDMSALETLGIDQEIIRLSGKDRPRALFIPTASYDNPERWEIFQEVYGDRLGCETDVLYLLGVSPARAELEEKILSADIIYVGGGNTLKMMRRWRRLGVDSILKAAHDRGSVLCGVSAGAICWFTYGHSDSMSFYNPDDWRYIRVRCMGLLDGFCCPHYNSDTAGVPREQDFHQMFLKYGGTGVAIDNNCALAFIDDGYRVMTSQPGAGAFRVSRRRGEVVVERLEQRQDLTPISTLIRSG